MADYKITQEGLKEIKAKTFRRLLLIIIAACAFVSIISVLRADYKQDLWFTLPAMVIMMALVFTFSIRTVRRNIEQTLGSFALTITDQYIARYQLNTPTIKIPFEEIKLIEKNSKNTLVVKGNSSADIIYILPQTDNFSEIESILNKVKPIRQMTSQNIFVKYSAVFTIGILALMVVVYVSMNKILVLISGIVVSGSLIWSFFQLQTNKNLETKIKRSSWMIWIVILSVATITIMKLTGNYK